MRPLSTRRSLLGFAAALTACPLCSALAADGPGAPHWGYEGADGPANWGGLSPDFKACSFGVEQTPVDLTHAIKAQTGPVKFVYQRVPLTIVNTGYTIQMATPPGSKMIISGTTYELVQFHFHHPSEHLLNGNGFDMELHFVHQSPSGALAVAGVFIKPGATNSALAPIWAAMPSQKTDPKTIAGVTIEPARLLPKDRTYFRYMGSLTIPPCTEGLNWTVFRTPIEASPEQIRAFAALYPMNARPLQKLNHRFLLES